MNKAGVAGQGTEMSQQTEMMQKEAEMRDSVHPEMDSSFDLIPLRFDCVSHLSLVS